MSNDQISQPTDSELEIACKVMNWSNLNEDQYIASSDSFYNALRHRIDREIYRAKEKREAEWLEATRPAWIFTSYVALLIAGSIVHDDLRGRFDDGWSMFVFALLSFYLWFSACRIWHIESANGGLLVGSAIVVWIMGIQPGSKVDGTGLRSMLALSVFIGIAYTLVKLSKEKRNSKTGNS